jgi:hypothetical protein
MPYTPDEKSAIIKLLENKYQGKRVSGRRPGPHPGFMLREIAQFILIQFSESEQAAQTRLQNRFLKSGSNTQSLEILGSQIQSIINDWENGADPDEISLNELSRSEKERFELIKSWFSDKNIKKMVAEKQTPFQKAEISTEKRAHHHPYLSTHRAKAAEKETEVKSSIIEKSNHDILKVLHQREKELHSVSINPLRLRDRDARQFALKQITEYVKTHYTNSDADQKGQIIDFDKVEKEVRSQLKDSHQIKLFDKGTTHQSSGLSDRSKYATMKETIHHISQAARKELDDKKSRTGPER